MQLPPPALINAGIMREKSSGLRFTFRMFADQPLGWAYVYPEDKTEEQILKELEFMRISSSKERGFVQFTNSGTVLPVYWDGDDICHIPVGFMNVYAGLMIDDFELLEIEPAHAYDHIDLYSVFCRHHTKDALLDLKNKLLNETD